MATVVWDSGGIVLIDYLEHSRTITETYYANLDLMSSGTEREETRKVTTSCPVSSPAHYVIASTDCDPKCRFQTAPPPIVFARLVPLFVSKTKKKKSSWKDVNLMTTKCYAPRMAGWKTKIKNSSTMAYGLWRIAAWTKCISVEENYVEKWQKYHAHILLFKCCSECLRRLLLDPKTGLQAQPTLLFCMFFGWLL